MPAPINGPRAKVSTGRNRRTIQNIASKGGNMKTALGRDRQTGLGGQLNQAPKPQVATTKPKSTYTPSESIKKLAEIRSRAGTSLATPIELPGAANFAQTMGLPAAATAVPQANVTAMMLLAARRASQGQGGDTTPSGQTTGRLQELAQRMAAKRYGWGKKKQWDALRELVMRESSWNPKADNPTSTAYGLFQFLDSTRANYGIGLNASPKKQIAKGLQYIEDRYGSPKAALKFHDENNWY